MKPLFILCLLLYGSFSFANEEKSGGWSDIKSGTMKVIRGASKGIKKAANKIDKKIEENQREDEREEKEEYLKKKKK